MSALKSFSDTSPCLKGALRKQRTENLPFDIENQSCDEAGKNRFKVGISGNILSIFEILSSLKMAFWWDSVPPKLRFLLNILIAISTGVPLSGTGGVFL